MSKKSVFIVLLIGLIFLISGIPQIFAQETKSDEFTLEEITVTAQKRAENQQKVAIAMEVITGDQMKELGYTNVSDILANVGNAVINKAGDGYRIALRGVTDDFGTFGGLTTSTPTVAISTDGVYSNRNDRGNSLYDVERMEVLYGPQSTMYANTSPGGIVNVVTAAPKTGKFEGSGTVELGNYNYKRAEGSLNVPLSGKTALRAAFSYAKRDGYISNGGDDEDTKSARLKALYQPSEDVSLIITGEASKQGGHMFSSVDEFAHQSDREDLWTSSKSVGEPSNKKQQGLNGNFTFSTGIGTITAVPSWSKSTDHSIMEGRGPGELPSHMQFNQTEKSGELRMTSPADFLFKWIAGFDYYKSNNHSTSTTEGSAQVQYSGYWDQTKALYGNVTYPITNAFRATAGARKNWAKMTTHNETINSPTPQTMGPPQPNQRVIQTGSTYTIISDNIQEYPNTDYKLGVEYDLGTNSMVYADYSTSYRFQGQSMPDANGNYPPPEKMKAYTLGAKNRFLNNKLQVNISAYWYDYKNKFASGNPTWFIYMWEDDPRLLAQYGHWLDLNGNGREDTAADNDGRGQPSLADPVRAKWGDYRSRGIDLQTNWMITSSDRVDFSYSYMDDEWTHLDYKYVYDWIYPEINLDGATNVNAPKHTIVLAYTHNFVLPNGGTITPRFDTRYQTKYIVSFKKADSPWRDQEAYHISNFSLSYAHSNGMWTVNAYVKNLENYGVKKSLFGTGEDPVNQKMNYEMMIGAPRTYGAVLSVKF